MHPAAAHTQPLTHPTPQPGGDSGAVPTTYVGAFLQIVRTLLGYGRHLDTTVPAQATHPRFPTLAACFGTHDLRRILAHVQRGILRAMMLERYLLARAAQGRDIAPTPRPEPAQQAEIEGLELKLRPPAQPKPASRPTDERRLPGDPDHPLNFAMPTLKELEMQVRRRSIGRTIAEICLDLGVSPSLCDGGFWSQIDAILWHFGGRPEQIYEVRERRRKSFRKERNRMPDTWDRDWQDRPKDAIRAMLGYLLGEPPPDIPLASPIT